MTEMTVSTAASPSLVIVSVPFFNSAGVRARSTGPDAGLPSIDKLAAFTSSFKALAASSIHACSCVDV